MQFFCLQIFFEADEPRKRLNSGKNSFDIFHTTEHDGVHFSVTRLFRKTAPV